MDSRVTFHANSVVQVKTSHAVNIRRSYPFFFVSCLYLYDLSRSGYSSYRYIRKLLAFS